MPMRPPRTPKVSSKNPAPAPKSQSKAVKPKIDIVDPHMWAKELTLHMTTEVLKLIQHEESNFGTEFGDTVRLSFLSSFIASIVFEVLNSKVEGARDKAHADAVIKGQYADFKDALQNAMAAGFQGAVQTHTGKTAEFLVQIIPVSAPINSIPC